jgi:hypothetical protein
VAAARRFADRFAARITAGIAAGAFKALVQPAVEPGKETRAAARITARVAAGVRARIAAFRLGFAGRLASVRARIAAGIRAWIAAVAAATKTLQQPAGAGVTSIGQTEQGGDGHHRKQNSRLHGKSPRGGKTGLIQMDNDLG